MVVFTRACDGECESGGRKCPLRLVFGKRPTAAMVLCWIASQALVIKIRKFFSIF
jgi:hypothetical protein